MLSILLKELKARWAEFSLGALIVALVVIAFIMQRTLSQAAESDMHDLAHKLGNNMLVIPDDMQLDDFYSFKYGTAVMSEDTTELIKKSEAGIHVKMSQPALSGNLMHDGEMVVVIGKKSPMLETPNSPDAAIPAIVTEQFAERFRIQPESTLVLNGTTIQVAAITQNDTKLADYSVIVPLEAAQRILGKPKKINSLHLGGCWCSIDIPALGKKIERAIPGTKAITVAGMIQAQKGILAVMHNYSNVFYLAAILIVSGTILLLNLSHMKKYAREFGLIMAIGAPKRFICATLFIKAGLIAITGSIIGFLFGVPLTKIAARLFLDMTANPSIDLAAPVFAMSLLAGFLGACIPAYKALHRDPVEIMREV